MARAGPGVPIGTRRDSAICTLDPPQRRPPSRGIPILALLSSRPQIRSQRFLVQRAVGAVVRLPGNITSGGSYPHGRSGKR